VNGLTASTTFSASFTTGVGTDTVSPTVVLVSFPDGFLNVGANANIRVRFSKPINPLTASGNSIVVTTANGVTVPTTISFSNNNQDVLAVPNVPLPDNTQITLTVSGISDLAGNAAAPKTTHFTTRTGPDTTSPVALYANPFSGASNVPLNTNIMLQISEPVDPGSVNSNSFTLFDDQMGQPVTGSYSVSADGRTITFVPSALLAGDRLYSVLFTDLVTYIGNITDLALAQQQSSYSRSRLDVASTEAEIRRNRERFNRLLGLWDADTDWQIAGELPEVPSSDLPMRALERLAISQRLDLQADYLQVTSQVKNLGLTKSFRLVGALDFGINSERETDSQTRTGPTFAIELPIFNQGQARIARGEAALRQSQDKFEALAVDVRSQIRELRDELTSKREIARFYQDELLPGQRRILNESLNQYNAMEIDNFELFSTKAEEARTEREYVDAVRDYWITRVELERAVGGNLNPRQPVDGKSQSVLNARLPRPAKNN